MCVPKILNLIICSKTLLFLATGCCPLVWTVFAVLKCSQSASISISKCFFGYFFIIMIIPSWPLLRHMSSVAGHIPLLGKKTPLLRRRVLLLVVIIIIVIVMIVMVVIIIAILIINKISQHPWQEHSGGKHHHRQHLCHCHHKILDIMITSSLSLLMILIIIISIVIILIIAHNFAEIYLHCTPNCLEVSLMNFHCLEVSLINFMRRKGQLSSSSVCKEWGFFFFCFLIR